MARSKVTVVPDSGGPGGGYATFKVYVEGRNGERSVFDADSQGSTGWLFRSGAKPVGGLQTFQPFTVTEGGGRAGSGRTALGYRVLSEKHILIHGDEDVNGKALGTIGCLRLKDLGGFSRAAGKGGFQFSTSRTPPAWGGREAGYSDRDDDHDDRQATRRRSARDRDDDGREDARGHSRRHTSRDATAHNPFGDFEIPGSNSNIRYDAGDNDAPARRAKKHKARERDDDDDQNERPSRRTRYAVADARETDGPSRTPSRKQVASKDEGIDAWNRGGGNNPFGRG